jgi:DNA modification methylase
MTGRVCHAIEISPAYIDVAVKRWQDFTGKQRGARAPARGSMPEIKDRGRRIRSSGGRSIG